MSIKLSLLFSQSPLERALPHIKPGQVRLATVTAGLNTKALPNTVEKL